MLVSSNSFGVFPILALMSFCMPFLNSAKLDGFDRSNRPGSSCTAFSLVNCFALFRIVKAFHPEICAKI